MCRQVHAHQVALAAQAHDVGPYLGRLDGRSGLGGHFGAEVVAEERAHQVVGVLTVALAVSYKLLGQCLAAGVGLEVVLALDTLEAVKGAGVGQVLEGASVDGAGGHTLDKVVDVSKGFVAARLDDGVDNVLAHALDCRQAEADIALAVDAEGGERLVDVGAEDRDAHRAALVHKHRQLAQVREVARQHGGHVFAGVVGLEVGRLEGHPAVAGGVALVEGVRGEFFPVLPYLVEHFGLVAVFLAALHELALEVVHLVDELLTHGLAQRVALAAGKVCQQTRQQHHLLLVDGDAVGVLEVLVHLGDVVDDGALAVLALDKVGDVVHGARTIEGVHGDEVLEG